MRLATFNVENLFDRPKAMNLATWKDGKKVLEDYHALNTLIQEPTYTEATKKRLLEIMERHKGLIQNRESEYLVLRDIRGKFLAQPRNKPVQVAANGRGDWIGWFELLTEPVSAVATENTARVMGLLEADVLGVVEAEDRIGLKRFNEDILSRVAVPPFRHVMLVDGNDPRGIDVGILTRDGYDIVRMLSHVDDTDQAGVVFSRDCVEYEIRTPTGNTLLVLLNHFKSKGYGNPAQSAAKRLRQAARVREIYEERRRAGAKYVAVLGDFNEIPANAPLDPLLRDGANLTDIMAHAKFRPDGRPGTHGNGTASGKLDYILMSPELSAKVRAGGVERRGVWGGAHGTLFPHLDTMTKAEDAASDHAALWAELDI